MRFSLLLALVLGGLFANEEIEVLLPTASSLEPVKVILQNGGSSFSDTYLNSLKKVLEFDLGHNGYMTQAENNPFYTIQTTAVKKELRMEAISRGAVKKFSPLGLTGNLNMDRRKIHKAADGILESLLGKKGVASLHILYSKKVPNGDKFGHKWTSEIWICDSDGENGVQLTEEGGYAIHPVFIPTKKDYFIYVSYKNGQPRIYLADLKKALSTPLISLRGNQLLPSIAPNAKTIAFVCDAAGRPDLFIQPFEPPAQCIGRPKQIFSAPRSTQASSSFSPDGTKLAFVSDKDGPPRIYVMDLTHSEQNVTLITRENRENVTPSWSSDGTKLAYSSKTDGVRQIWIYDFIKDEEWQLTKGDQNKENPLWAPDGLHIVYNTEEKEMGDLYIVNLNQQSAVKITSGVGKKRFPAWEPY